MSDRTLEVDPDRRDPPARPRWRILAIGAWLLFLAYPLTAVLRYPQPAGRILGLVLVATFVATYLYLLLRIRWRVGRPRFRPRRVVPLLVGLVVITGALVPFAGPDALVCLVFITAAAMATLPIRFGIAVAALMLAVSSLAALTVPGWQDHNESLAVVLAAASTFAMRLAMQRTDRLLDVERELGRTALDQGLDQERARIARDLHDILGHSLTVISLKAQVADRTFDDDPQRARAEILEIERLSRDALADVRATALGVRGISLPGEIAEARAALTAAGIEPDLPGVTDEVDSRHRELFAWTIREAVTNVVRHSRARTCTVELGRRRVAIIDDGLGPQAPTTSGDPFSGHGLEGLRRRVERAGGTMMIGPGPTGNGFAIEVEVPGDQPLD
ncbi:sensor histidine kinase [Millisia brevis]|uniref:sensor histidine kinase n=1 Tax=Millisia brevis TaxID=264148 RepID=UPI00083421B7|nr:histidine kinase [Millisia brevis]